MTGTTPAPARSAGPLLIAAVTVGLGLALGGLGGWLWYLWWAPARPGRVYDTAEGLRWYPDPWDPGQAQVFSGTAEYAVIGVLVGLAIGVVAAFLGRHRAYAGLAWLLVATAAAAAVAHLVGVRLSPPDPQSLVESAGKGAELPAAIDVRGWTPYLCWPLGGLIGWLVTTLLLNSAEGVRDLEASTWLSPAGSEPSPPR